MKSLKLFIFLFFSCLFLHGQKNGYEIIGNEVVFTFDIRDYKKATHDRTGKRIDFSDLDIYNVSVSGQFNNWSRDGWRMLQVNGYLYQLKKPLARFDDEISWEFKFVINRNYWAEPDKSFPNIVKARKNGMLLRAFNLKMYTAVIDPDGNACFKLHGFKGAKEVILTGDFNRWDESAFKMNATDDGWELVLQLKPGTYEYKFIVDGNWMDDPGNPDKVYNEYHTFNSVCTLTKEVSFYLKGFILAKQVYLSGGFNSWNETDLPMKKNKDGWSLTLDLPGGKHHYKYIVDGKWIIDPENPLKEYDSSGNINSAILVE